MTKVTRTLLAVSVVTFAVGLILVSGLVPVTSVALYVVLPFGAIFFGLFLISLILEHEVSKYDAEQRPSKPVTPAPKSGHSRAEKRQGRGSLVKSHS